MDFDSSSKFISSLAKFLQSLCNGYVEFNNGVEVIGHIYLNVDTGKKIDYVLNEKVCKTDENSVTFISNSFHAQPAEKPKPVVKEKPPATPEPSINNDSDIILMEDNDSDYQGPVIDQFNTAQGTSSPHSKPARSHGASKRPHAGQSFSSHRASAKAARYNSSTSSHSAGIPPPNNNDSAFNLSDISAPTESELSHLSQVFPHNTTDPSGSEEKDIKPILDKDMNVVRVKEEHYDPSGESRGGGNNYEDQQLDDTYYSQDQSYEANDDYYNQDGSDSMQGSKFDPRYSDSGSAGPAGPSQGCHNTSGQNPDPSFGFLKSEVIIGSVLSNVKWDNDEVKGSEADQGLCQTYSTGNSVHSYHDLKESTMHCKNQRVDEYVKKMKRVEAYMRKRDGAPILETPAKVMKARCNCKSIGTNCTGVSDARRLAIHKDVWSLSVPERKNWVKYYVHRTNVASHRPNFMQSTKIRQYTLKYYLDADTGLVKVCKEMFINTTNLTEHMIRNNVNRNPDLPLLKCNVDGWE